MSKIDAITAPGLPSPGQIVHVRQRQYLVEDIVPPPGPGDATLLRLSCLDDEAQGQPLEVLWEREVDPAIVTGAAFADRADRRIEVFNGPTPPARREEIKRAFNTDPRKHPVRILIATDAAREGLNLQLHCNQLVLP